MSNSTGPVRGVSGAGGWTSAHRRSNLLHGERRPDLITIARLEKHFDLRLSGNEHTSRGKRRHRLADKANLEPRLPPALTRAADIVREHAPDRLAQQAIDQAIDTLSAPYPERTVRTLRAATNSSIDHAEQAERILAVIRDLGLEPYTPPEPLPEITPDDIHLVCWLALV